MSEIIKPVFINPMLFSKLVSHALKSGFSDGFDSKKWWKNKRSIILSLDDLIDPWHLLPVIAFMAEQKWDLIGPCLGTTFEARFYPQPDSQYGYGLSAVIASSIEMACLAVTVGLVLSDLPASNFDPMIEAFMRVQDMRENGIQ
jgi:hypothetical protein